MSVSNEMIEWAYRLFLDREPENEHAVSNKVKFLARTQDVRREFLSSLEFKSKNPGFHSLTLTGNEPPFEIEMTNDLRPIFDHIQQVWEHLGETEPYWSVLTWDEFKSTGTGTPEDFYATGQKDVTVLRCSLKRNNIDEKSLRVCLEFGCGLGRVTHWLAKEYETVFGLDISSKHLRIAQRYFDEQNIGNIELRRLTNLEDLMTIPNVDLIFTTRVLQHNPPPIIAFIIGNLLKALNPGGIAFFQLPTYRSGYRFRLQDYLSIQINKQQMEMHILPQYEVFDIINKEGGKVLEVLEDDCTSLRYGERSNSFIVQKI